MTNYGEDERRRQEMCERFEHAINCMDISTISMMAFERIAKEPAHAHKNHFLTLKNLNIYWPVYNLIEEL